MEDIKVGALEGFIGIFIKPSKTMKKIVDQPTCLIPVLCLAIFSGFSIYLNFDLLYNQAYNTLISSGTITDASTASTATLAAIGAGLAASIVVVIASWMILSCFLVFITRNFGGDTNFKEMRAITAHANYILLISILIKGIAVFITKDITKVFGLNLYTLFPDVTDIMFKTVLQSVDVFSFWQYALIAVGISQIEDMDRKKVITVVVITYVLKVIVSILIALLSGQSAQI